MALPNLPAQGQNPWYIPRTAWDTAVDLELQGMPLKALDTSGVAQGVIYPVGAAVGAVTFSSLQTAADLARSENKRLVASGSITTSQTLIIRCDADLSQVSITYTGSTTAVQLGGTPGIDFVKRIRAPKVYNSVSWGGTRVGIRAINLNSCPLIEIPEVSNFDVGLQVEGINTGNVSNLFVIGHLSNNKVNLRLTASGTGWCNQNVFMSGRYSHSSGMGVKVAGAAHIVMDDTTTNLINNNEWVNPSLEGDVSEFIVDFSGRYNLVENGRFETAAHNPPIRWQSRADRNTIFNGAGLQSIEETFTSATSAANSIISSQASRYRALGVNPVATFEQTSDSSRAIHYFMHAGAAAAGVVPSTGYSALMTSRILGGKRSSEGFNRLEVDWYTGQIRFGSGAVAPVQGFQYATNGLRALGPLAPASYTTALRPTASGLSDGSQIYDSTLGKTIMAKSAVWVNLDGTAL